MTLNNPLLTASHISKSYDGISVLNDISFSVPRNSVVSLVGENGAGKSTLFNILSGLTDPSSGAMTLNNEAFRPANYLEAWTRGVSRVFQEQSLILNVPVYENLVIGQEARFTRFGIVNRSAMIRVAQAIIEDAGLEIDVRRITGNYDFSRRQAIEIARACIGPIHLGSCEHPLILLDEPTSALDRQDEDAFYALVARLRKRASFIFVSHRLTEVMDLSDHIHVLRDGRLVESFNFGEATEAKLHENMVGRERASDFYHETLQRDVSEAPTVLKVTNLSGEGYADVSFDLRQGEILGIGGLMESGKSRLGKGLAGVVPPYVGEVQMLGRAPGRPGMGENVRAGLGYVPAERLVEGMVPDFSVAWNISLASGADTQTNRFGIWKRKDEIRVSEKYIKELRIRSATPNLPCSRLSGGNQQKVVLARWLSRKPKLLILDNPTRGVDAGAKEEIYQVLRQLTAKGVSIVLISDELMELIGLSNRILIMQRGRIVESLPAETANKPSETKIVALMMPSDHTLPSDLGQTIGEAML